MTERSKKRSLKQKVAGWWEAHEGRFWIHSRALLWKPTASKRQRVRPLYRQDFTSLKGIEGDLNVKQGGTAKLSPLQWCKAFFIFRTK